MDSEMKRASKCIDRFWREKIPADTQFMIGVSKDSVGRLCIDIIVLNEDDLKTIPTEDFEGFPVKVSIANHEQACAIKDGQS